ncbi:MAG: family 1 glycosylhydrolase, partial [Olsenella sp.]|nr:family 1 glycosylhydrolase [Olsenella sp.]
LDCANRLAALAGGRLELLPEDLEQLAAAAPHNDCLGINYYQSNFLKAYDGPNDCHHNSTGEKGTERHALQGIGEYVARPEIPRTDWDWMIYPQGLYDLVMRICRQWPHYKELYVTENGMASKDRLEEGAVHDEERIHYIREHLRWALKAIAEGAHLRGYFVWSLMDVFSWNNGYNKRYGLFYVDFDTQERIPKDSARWYAKVAQERFLDT